jgi:branched-subunit amino acid aminotransferase/4-amino-4-deoxychorismate lyase
MLVWLNGLLVDARTARVSALDRGLLHGDGAYDTWRTYGGRPFALAAHLRRLTAATKRLGLPPPGARAAWEARTRVLLRRNGLADGALRLTITRGDAGSGPAPSARARPTVLLTARALPPDLAALQARGVAATLLPFGRDAGPGWGELKLVGHASAVLGKMLARKRRAFEGLYVTPDGRVTEGATANLFVVERGSLVTPPADGSILRGVTRDLVLDLAKRAGIPTREAPVDVARLLRADEVFITASTIEILPVVRIDARRIATARPGALTRTLLARYRAVVGPTPRGR